MAATSRRWEQEPAICTGLASQTERAWHCTGLLQVNARRQLRLSATAQIQLRLWGAACALIICGRRLPCVAQQLAGLGGRSRGRHCRRGRPQTALGRQLLGVCPTAGSGHLKPASRRALWTPARRLRDASAAGQIEAGAMMLHSSGRGRRSAAVACIAPLSPPSTLPRPSGTAAASTVVAKTQPLTIMNPKLTSCQCTDVTARADHNFFPGAAAHQCHARLPAHTHIYLNGREHAALVGLRGQP